MRLPSNANDIPTINPPWSRLNRVNAILNGRGKTHSAVDYCGTLSIKCILHGEAIYEAAGCRFAVTDANYLILNDRQTYNMTIASDDIVETFCIFFEPGFAATVLNDLVTSSDRLLDAPFDRRSQPVDFFERLYPHDETVTPVIRSIYSAVRHNDASAGWYEEHFHLLLGRLLQVHRGQRSEIDRLPGVRAATRSELYRRLHRARDFMDSSLDEALSLECIAEVAWLSPHHFLRLFKQVYGITPHQHLTRKRIERAQLLLVTTEMPIAQIGIETGLASASAFSRLFRNQVGVSPEAYRRVNGVLPAK